MRITIISLFPEYFQSVLSSSIIGRAQVKKKISVDFVNPRDFAAGKHKSVDDKPYGGGAGMLLRADVIVSSIESVKKRDSHIVLLTPQGSLFNQKKAVGLSKRKHLILVCGHYEGFDERVRHYVDEELSIGDFILTGGEAAATVVIEAAIRLIPGVLGKGESYAKESFMKIDDKTLLEYPQYTRPEEFRGEKVPKVLLSGNHEEIEKWRLGQALKRTKKRRPDLA